MCMLCSLLVPILIDNSLECLYTQSLFVMVRLSNKLALISADLTAVSCSLSKGPFCTTVLLCVNSLELAADHH